MCTCLHMIQNTNKINIFITGMGSKEYELSIHHIVNEHSLLK